MAGCDSDKDYITQCLKNPTRYPIEITAAPIDSMNIIRLINMYPWLGEFVRFRGDALILVQRKYTARYTKFTDWIVKQRTLPLVHERPSGGEGMTFVMLPNDVKRRIATQLDDKSLRNLRYMTKLTPNHPVAATLSDNDKSVLDRLSGILDGTANPTTDLLD